MTLPKVVLTEYTSSDLPMLRYWREDEDVLQYVHELEHQERDDVPGSRVSAGKYIARPRMRRMVRDVATETVVGFVSVQ
ncbi:hypothetical protein [Nocardia flavorosea]|uniref:Uncharacterized protein n=1 Tax=Nocardia flavorosea TaxID=53429 RepID=A0A846Y9C6_9NOCA|nr:hypothetical protein [Nocardia flavorosea]NKY56176.1 hypothetical protein [Nocardia flavorosea]